MLASNERASPCSARFWRSSSGRLTSTTSPSCSSSMGRGTSWRSVPRGPVTVTVRSATSNWTPAGIWMGSLPMRDTGAHLPDGALAVRPVLEVDAQDLAHRGVLHLVAGHVALLLEDLGDLDLDLGVGHHDVVVVGGVAVAQPGEHVGDRISHRHVDSPPYQLDLVMPGSSPAWASSRTQMRHRPNLRNTARGLPQRWQRV